MKMTTPRISRGAKSRVFLYIGAVIFVGITVIIIHETQTRVEDIRKSSEKCQQQQESLAAQLQVIFEYKTRLEKSVQQEKSDHKKTHDELSTQLEIEKTKRAREVLEATNKLASLQQHYKLLQGQHEDLAEECKGVRNEAFKAWEEQRTAEGRLQKMREQTDMELKIYKSQVTQLKSENEKLKKLVKEDGNEVSNLQDENQRLETEIQQCKRDVATCPTKSSSANAAPNLQSPVAASSSASPMQNNGKDPLHNVLQQPDGPKGSSAASLSSTRSTPKSNVAPVPAPGPDAPKPLVGAYEQVPPGVVPPGVVPAPQMMLHDDYTNNRDNFLPPSRDMAPPVLPGPFHNPFAARKNQEDEEEQKKAVGAAPPDQKMWHQREEIEEDDDHHGAAGFQHYKEDEADRGAGRWNGGNHHLPEGERHEDLQLEDPDEDEGDDDVDQIDYGNDVINNNNQHGANLKQKSHRKSPMGNKHDSVMVNPK